MAHLAKDAAVRAGDALDGQHRAVRVVTHVHRRAAGQVHILRCDLTIFDQLVQQLSLQTKRPSPWLMAIRCSSLMSQRLSHGLLLLATRYAPSILVAMNRVEGQRRVLLGDGTDLAVGDKAQLDECLEAVADT